MNRYGQQAMDHWSRWLPSRYSQIEDPESFFARMGEEAQTQIEELTSALEARHAQELALLPYLEKVGRLNALQAQATEMVMAEMLLPPELRDSDPANPVDPLDAPDPMSQWMDPTGMPVDRTHPLWRMADDDSVSVQEYRAAYRIWTRQMHEQQDSRGTSQQPR